MLEGNMKYDWSDLYDLYVNQQLSTTDIAKLKGGKCSAGLVGHALALYSIPARSRPEAQNLVINSGKKITHSKENHVGWSGGRKKHSAGYILVYAPDHFNPTKTGWIREHRLIWEQVHNQPLPKGWIVHHLNDVKADNRPENLYGCSKEKHGALAEEHKKRIRALEAKIKLLEKTLDDSQLMFRFGDS